MVSKEMLILIAVLLILVVAFMYWSEEQSNEMEQGVEEKIDEVLDY